MIEILYGIIYVVTQLIHSKVTKIYVDFIRQWRMIFFLGGQVRHGG